MRPEYDVIKFFSNHDWSLGGFFEKSKTILDEFDGEKVYSDINEVIELYNIHRIFTSKSIKAEYTQPYIEKIQLLMPIIARFFNSIDDNSFIEYNLSVCFVYVDDFWTLVDKFKVYERITDSTFSDLLNEPDTTLYNILEHKGLVHHYDQVLAEHMRKSDQSARIIIGKYLERNDRTSETACNIPTSLRPCEYESIFDSYIDSDHPNVGVLKLLASSQGSKECPLSDELRLKAKRKAEAYLKDRASVGVSYSFAVGVSFIDAVEPVSIDNSPSNQFPITYDEKWIRENADYPTLLNNFIYLFQFTDIQFRCSFPAIQSQLSTIEKALGVKGKKEYEIGTAFHVADMKSTAEMQGYMALLSDMNIRIEEIFQWFFTEYLQKEFNAFGFVFNAPTSGQSYLEKCRNLPSEMDGILKQYSLFVKNHTIDRELLEMSSNPVVFEALPSMTDNKYVYVNSAEIQRELFLLFSDQSMLNYLPNHNETYKSFFEVLSTRQVSIEEYPEWKMVDIRWLEKRGTISTDTSGLIYMNKPRVYLLRDLYEHDVICASYYKDKSELEKLIVSSDLRYESSLFTIPEQHYLNFMLNKSEYSNGQDLRNKYIHSTYPLDVQQQQRDYLCLLKIMTVIIIKINEEFCLTSSFN